MHGIKVLMAKNYIDNLSEEVRKGLREKAEQGIPPYKADWGIATSKGLMAEDDRHRPRVADRREAVRVLCDGKMFVARPCRDGREAGLLYRKSGASADQRRPFIFRNRLYTASSVERQGD